MEYSNNCSILQNRFKIIKKAEKMCPVCWFSPKTQQTAAKLIRAITSHFSVFQETFTARQSATQAPFLTLHLNHLIQLQEKKSASSNLKQLFISGLF